MIKLLIRNYYLYKKKKMLSKTKVIKTISGFPENFSIDELVDKMILLDKIEKGLLEVKEGKVISHEEAKEKMSKWLK